MDAVKFGPYGLRFKPTFDQALDTAKKPLRIPLPDRSAKLQALSFYREKLRELQASAAQVDVSGYEHRLSDETVPESVLHVQPSPSADDAFFEEMTRHSKQVWENEVQRRQRHRVDAEAQERMRGERAGDLLMIHDQGSFSAVMQGEVPLDERLKVETEKGTAQGYVIEKKVVDRAAPHNLPRAEGYGSFPEFPTFAELNLGLVRPTGEQAGMPLPATQGSYESHRRALNISKDY
jgi:hypothetical protein